ncbi:MAG: hypothetical protein Cons2KO_05970 [Congregibacter sp.]
MRMQGTHTRQPYPDIAECFQSGWDLYKREPVLLSGATLLVGILNAIAGSIPFAGLLTSGPLLAGLYLLIIALRNDENPGIASVFDGYQHFLPVLIASVLISVFVSVGLFLLVLPGIYAAVVYGFTILNIVRKGLDFWPAMELSRTTITPIFWHYLIFAFLMLLILIAGAIPFALGLLVAVPVCLAAQLHFYEQLDC